MIVKALAVVVYNGEEKPIAICIQDERSRKPTFYQVEDMPFDEVSDFLEGLTGKKEVYAGGGGAGEKAPGSKAGSSSE